MIKSIAIKDCRGDITKRWHVEYLEFNPLTGKWERHREYGQVNRKKDPAERMELLLELQAHIINCSSRLRAAGSKTIIYWLRLYMAEKAALRKTSQDRIKASLRHFITWLQAKSHHDLPLQAIRKDHIREFRKSLQKANRTVNNIVSDVSTFFQYYIDQYDDLLYNNPCKGIRPLPAVSETHVAYTGDQQSRYFAWMAEHNPQLLLYCQFVGLGFLRCNEARHLRVGDLDFSGRQIILWAGHAKNRRRELRPMLKVFYDKLIAAGVHRYPKEYYVFSHGGHPGEKITGIHYFRKRFTRLKKQFGLDRRYTIYGFKHTSVSKMIRSGAPWREIMKYTGHSSMTAFEKYQRSIANDPAEDLSKYVE